MFSKAAFSEIRHLNLEIQTPQLFRLDYGTTWQRFDDTHGPGSFANLTAEDKRSAIIGWHHQITSVQWDNMQLALCRFQREMDCVEMDFTHAFCSAGCCRPLDACNSRWIAKLAPKSLNVTGVMAAEEASFGYNMSHSGARLDVDELKARHNLRFVKHGEKTEWGAWKIEKKKSADK